MFASHTALGELTSWLCRGIPYRSVVLLAATGAPVCWACEAPTPSDAGTLGSECLLHSDCDGDLECRLGSCREPCERAADCVSGARCLIAPDQSNGFCSLPDEEECSRDAQCPTDLSCAFGLCLYACGKQDECSPLTHCATDLDRGVAVCIDGSAEPRDAGVGAAQQEAGAGMDAAPGDAGGLLSEAGATFGEAGASTGDAALEKNEGGVGSTVRDAAAEAGSSALSPGCEIIAGCHRTQCCPLVDFVVASAVDLAPLPELEATLAFNDGFVSLEVEFSAERQLAGIGFTWAEAAGTKPTLNPQELVLQLDYSIEGGGGIGVLLATPGAGVCSYPLEVAPGSGYAPANAQPERCDTDAGELAPAWDLLVFMESVGPGAGILSVRGIRIDGILASEGESAR